MQDGLTQPPHGFHASGLRLTEGASLFAHLTPKNAFGHAFCFLLKSSGRKTNFLLPLRRSILGSENLSHRMNDA